MRPNALRRALQGRRFSSIESNPVEAAIPPDAVDAIQAACKPVVTSH
jgi:hypothetical protein